MSSEGPEKNRIDWIYIMVVLIFAVPLLLFVGIIFFLDSFLGSSDAVMGVSGFVQEGRVRWHTPDESRMRCRDPGMSGAFIHSAADACS